MLGGSESERKRERETVRKRETETRTLNVSSHVHFTPLKKMGYAGIIIALEQHRVRVKEKDKEKRLCKRWCVMNKRGSSLSPSVVYFYKELLALCDVLQSLQIS